MFALPVEKLPDHPELLQAANAAYRELADCIHTGYESGEFTDGVPDFSVIAAWSLVHGFAHIVNQRLIPPLTGANRKQLMEQISRTMADSLSRD